MKVAVVIPVLDGIVELYGPVDEANDTFWRKIT